MKKINEAYEVLKSSTFSSSTQTSISNPQQPTPKDAKAYYNQGMEKAKRGRYKEVIEDFSYALHINPIYTEARRYRGLAYSKTGDTQKAIDDFRRVANLYLEQQNLNSYQDIVQLIKKLQISDTVNTVRANYLRLNEMLLANRWEEADRETSAVIFEVVNREQKSITREQEVRLGELMLRVFGKEQQKYLQQQGYFFAKKSISLTTENIIKLPSDVLEDIDALWVKASHGHFGFSRQKRIWQLCKNSTTYNYELFRKTIGWNLKQLVFSLNAPVGHLPISWSIGEQGNVDFDLLNLMFSRPYL